MSEAATSPSYCGLVKMSVEVAQLFQGTICLQVVCDQGFVRRKLLTSRN